MKTIVLTLVLVASLPVKAALAAQANASTAPIQEVSWEQLSESNGIRVFRREVPGNPIVDFKGDGIVAAPIAKVAEVVINTSRATEWVDSLIEARRIRETSPVDYVEYDHVGTPPIMKDRDFLSHVTVETDPIAKKITVRLVDIEDPAMPPNPKYVRGLLINSYYALSYAGPTKTHVEVEILTDPKGWVPKWVVNLFQRGWPRNTIESLRTQVVKPNITPSEFVKTLLPD